MIFRWDTIPLLRILFPLVIGILLFLNFDFSFHFSPIHFSIFTALFISILLWIRSRKVRFRYRWVFGTLVALLLVVMGFHRSQQKTEILKKEHFSNFLQDSSFLYLQIEAPLEEKEKTFKAEVKVLQVVNGLQSHNAIGKALAYFQKSEEVATLKYGDIVLTNSTFRQLEAPKNPDGFDYAAYMRNFQVYHQSYIRTDQWQETGKNAANPFFQKVYQIRNYFLQVIENKVGSTAEIGVASAILLGYKANLDDEVRETYANTGAMHILAVSGLHVGIIFIIINRMLFFLEKIHKRGKILKFILVIVVIWAYAFITGLPPSVSRAATMFTIFAIGELFSRRAFSFNALAASAIFLLLYNPYMIKMVGFQLSYAAVAAIMWLQNPIYRLIEVDNKLLDYIWKISSVSIAAQLGTAPLSVFYFHQFPTYFWLSNLVVIPAAGFILTIGIALLLLGNIPFLGDFLGVALKGLINSVYNSLQLIQYLPFSTIEGLVITDLQFWFLYVGMISTVLFFIFNQFKYLQVSLVMMLCITGLSAWHQFQSLQQKELVVYHISKETGIEFIAGKKSYLIGNEDVLKEKGSDLFQYNIAPHQLMSSISSLQFLNFNESTPPSPSIIKQLIFDAPFVQFYDKKILLLDDKTALPSDLKENIRVDYLILTRNPRISLQKALDWLDAKQIIFDVSNSYWQVNRWKSECELHGLNCHDVREKGAFVVNF